MLGILCLSAHGPYGGEFFYPAYSWAQSDRLALAMQFHDHLGMDFFIRAPTIPQPMIVSPALNFLQSYPPGFIFIFGRGNTFRPFSGLLPLAVLFAADVVSDRG
ncbi:MAG: hypothetical protein R3B47_16845 [Bacteroidia bacterium]